MHFLYYFFQGSKYICANSYAYSMSDPVLVFNRLFRLHTSRRLQKKFSLLADKGRGRIFDGPLSLITFFSINQSIYNDSQGIGCLILILHIACIDRACFILDTK